MAKKYYTKNNICQYYNKSKIHNQNNLGVIQMQIITSAIVSSTEMMKNYKECREKAESFDKIFILKNNQPEAVLFSITEYERLSAFIECMESLDENDIVKVIKTLPMEGNRKSYSLGLLRKDMNQIVAVDIIE